MGDLSVKRVRCGHLEERCLSRRNSRSNPNPNLEVGVCLAFFLRNSQEKQLEQM